MDETGSGGRITTEPLPSVSLSSFSRGCPRAFFALSPASFLYPSFRVVVSPIEANKYGVRKLATGGEASQAIYPSPSFPPPISRWEEYRVHTCSTRETHGGAPFAKA